MSFASIAGGKNTTHINIIAIAMKHNEFNMQCYRQRLKAFNDVLMHVSNETNMLETGINTYDIPANTIGIPCL